MVAAAILEVWMVAAAILVVVVVVVVVVGGGVVVIILFLRQTMSILMRIELFCVTSG